MEKILFLRVTGWFHGILCIFMRIFKDFHEILDIKMINKINAYHMEK